MSCARGEQKVAEPGPWIQPATRRAEARLTGTTAGSRARLLALLATAVFVYVLGLALIERHSRFLHAWADCGWPVMHAWAAIECFRSRGQRRFHRIAYFVLVAQNAISIVALAYWGYAELVLGWLSPFPTAADLVFVSYTPVYALAIFLLTGGFGNRSLSLRHIGDLGISIGTMLLVGLLIYYVPSAESRLPPMALELALAYPVLSCSSMAFGLVALLEQPPGGFRRVIALHFSALTMHATAYTLYGVAIMTRKYEVGHALDPLWFSGLALTVWAAREDRWLGDRVVASSHRAGPTPLDVVIPGTACAILVAAIAMFRDELPRTPPLAMVLASLLFLGSLGVRGIAVLRLERELTQENTVLLEGERAARAAAETLAHASALLSESPKDDRVLGTVARLVVEAMPGWCVIDLLEGGRLRRAAAEHVDPEKRSILAELGSRFPPRASSLTGQALKLERPVVVTPETVVKWSADDGDHMRLLRALGVEFGIAAPLVARGRMLGAMSVASATHRLRPIEEQLFVEVAHRAAIAIDNAELYRESQEALRVREEFIQLASHELNTPVTSLLLNLEAAVARLRRGAVRPEDMVKTAAMAAQQARNVAQLVGDLMDFTQLEHDWLALHTRPVELTALTRSVVERARAKLEWASCAVSLEVGPPITGSWDPLRIEKVLQKLLSNAVKFGAGKPIEVKVELVGEVARVSIADHGIGIDPSTQERIFSRFGRGVSAKNYGGLGLGLYVSRRLVEAHGGSIRVESEPGSGAKFIVDLPTAARAETPLPDAVG
jgi:signal transduction histidine kinase